MEAQMLSEKQLKKTLSAKKAVKKGVKSRNILAWPKSFDIWPALDTEANNELKTLLESLLALAKLPCCSLPFQVAKTVKGAERKEMRQKLYASKETDLCKTLRAKVLLGMNCVVRGITGANVAAVMVAGDNQQEQRLGKLVVDMCVQRDVPVVIVATLQEATRQCLGFGCLAVAVKKAASTGHFGVLVERVRKLSAALVQRHGPLAVKSERETKDVSLEIPVKQEVVSEIAHVGATSVYRYRSSRKTRAFVPEVKDKGELALWLAEEAEHESCPSIKTEPVECKPKVDFASQDFISFGADESGTPVEVKVKPELRAGVKVEAKLKRKADYDSQDFISFGNSSTIGSLEPKLKRKAESTVEQRDATALGAPNSTAAAKEPRVTMETKKPVVARPKLPKYQPLVVKSIQSNPTKKKKKMKKPKAAS